MTETLRGKKNCQQRVMSTLGSSRLFRPVKEVKEHKSFTLALKNRDGDDMHSKFIMIHDACSERVHNRHFAGIMHESDMQSCIKLTFATLLMTY